MILDFQSWHDMNIEQMEIEFAESGADRELDFDIETELEDRYNKYVQFYTDYETK